MSVDEFRRKRRKDSLEKWTRRALLAEVFFIPLSPAVATIAALVGGLLTAAKLKLVKDFAFRSLPFDVPALLFALLALASVFQSPDPAFSFYNYYN